MARVEIPIVVLNSATGRPVEGAAVLISRRGTGVLATWWTTESGGASSTGAILTDAGGRANGWVDRGSYKVSVTGTGLTPYAEPWDAVPASDSSIDSNWLPDASIPKAKFDAATSNLLLPVGVLLPIVGAVIPSGFLACNGANVSRSGYAELFALIGTAYGAGDGSTTFALPNMNGRAPAGMDATQTEFDVRGKSGGTKTHILATTEAGMPTHGHADSLAVGNAPAILTGSESANHAHNITAYGTSLNSGFTGMFIGFEGTTPLTTGNFVTSGRTAAHVHTLPAHGHVLNGAVTNATGVSAAAAHNNLQSYQVFNWIVKI